jgi:hypothetical protein
MGLYLTGMLSGLCTRAGSFLSAGKMLYRDRIGRGTRHPVDGLLAYKRQQDLDTGISESDHHPTRNNSKPIFPARMFPKFQSTTPTVQNNGRQIETRSAFQAMRTIVDSNGQAILERRADALLPLGSSSKNSDGTNASGKTELERILDLVESKKLDVGVKDTYVNDRLVHTKPYMDRYDLENSSAHCKINRIVSTNRHSDPHCGDDGR